MKHTHSVVVLAAMFFLNTSSLLSEAPEKITAPVSAGELVDKITILEIKTERITDDQKRNNAAFELRSLKDALDETALITPKTETQLEELTEQLLKVNKKLWDIEDDLRAKEAKQVFDKEFIELARSVYHNNDERCRIKRAINELTGSPIIEEKQYTEY